MLKGKPFLDDNLGEMARHLYLSVLFFRDPNEPEAWIAQALEHDIAAHGRTIEQARVAFERTVQGYFQLAAKHHQEPLASLKAAPDTFWEAWKRVAHKDTERLRSTDPQAPPAYVVQAITTESILSIQ